VGTTQLDQRTPAVVGIGHGDIDAAEAPWKVPFTVLEAKFLLRPDCSFAKKAAKRSLERRLQMLALLYRVRPDLDGLCPQRQTGAANRLGENVIELVLGSHGASPFATLAS
jgi:hypothetical protein